MLIITDKQGNKKKYSTENTGEKTPDGISVIFIREDKTVERIISDKASWEKFERYYKSIALDKEIYDKLNENEKLFIRSAGKWICKGGTLFERSLLCMEDIYLKYCVNNIEIMFTWQKKETENYQSERHEGSFRDIKIDIFKIRGLSQYVMTCRNVGILSDDLKSSKLEIAQAEAIRIVIDKIKQLNVIVKEMEND